MTEIKGPSLGAVVVGATYRHRKTGNYYEVIAVGRIEATLEKVVIYTRLLGTDRNVWVRPMLEFVDGRFEAGVAHP